MSDLSSFVHIVGNTIDGKITLEQAGSQLEALAQKVVGELGPGAQADVAAVVSTAKQVAGAAITLADADLAPYLAQGAQAVEGAVDGLLTVATRGGAAPLIPLVNGGIDQLAAALKSAIDAQALAWKAKLAATPAPTASAAA